MSGRSAASEPVPVFTCFEDFWKHYVTQHQHPVNQVMHIAGTFGGLACLGLAIFHSWIWLAALLPVGYGMSWIGHFLIERNRPLTFTYPLWSLRADYRLVGRLLLRRPLTRPTLALYQCEADSVDGAIHRQDYAGDTRKPTAVRVLSMEQRSSEPMV